MASFEVTEWAERADRFVEVSPALVLASWTRRRTHLQYEVSLPLLEDLPLRPLFVSQAFAKDVLDGACVGAECGPIAMPSAIGVPGDFLVTEPPHGREWLMHVAYLELLRAPWLHHLTISAPSLLDPVARWLGTQVRAGTLAVALSSAESAGLMDADVRVQQLVWWLEAALTRAGVPTRCVVAEDELQPQGRAFRDGRPIAAIAWWTTPLFSSQVPHWPAPPVDRRRVPELARKTGSRYATIDETDQHRVFKPFTDPWSVLQLSEDHNLSEGFLQARPSPPTVRLPFVRGRHIEWDLCHVELSVIGIEGRPVGAFARCDRVTPDGLDDIICPVVLL